MRCNLWGLNGMLLGLFAGAAMVVSLLWKQRVSPFIFGAGVALMALLTVTIGLNKTAFYERTGISVYVVILVAGILLFAGGFGLSVKCIRWLITVFSKRPKVS
jgi:hypothetical protein